MKIKEIIIWVFVIVFVSSTFTGFYLLNNDYNNKISQNKVLFENEISNLKDTINEQSDEIIELENKIDILESKQNNAISKLTDEIGRVEKDSLDRAQDLENQLGDLQISSQTFSSTTIQQVIKSVVSLHTDQGLGSGVVVGDDGYIVTNYHVVEGISALTIVDYDGKKYGGRLIKVDEDKDLALLQGVSLDLPKLSFEDEDNVDVGDRVIALGNPGGLSFTVTEGIISAKNRNRNSYEYYQTDVSINPGNSGGPLVNLNKKIVGINTFKIEGFEGVGFALNPETVKNFVNDAINEDKNGE